MSMVNNPGYPDIYNKYIEHINFIQIFRYHMLVYTILETYFQVIKQCVY